MGLDVVSIGICCSPHQVDRKRAAIAASRGEAIPCRVNAEVETFPESAQAVSS
jgi:hypothetical protein